MTKQRPIASDQDLFDLTVSIQPARSSWMQAVGSALGDEKTSVQLGIVVLLVRRLGPRVSQSMLAAETGVTPATLVRTIDQGEELGLLMRSKVAGDRRIREIELLPAGKKCASRIEKNLTALRRKLFGDVPAEDIKTARRVLRLLEERALALNRGDTPPKPQARSYGNPQRP